MGDPNFVIVDADPTTPTTPAKRTNARTGIKFPYADLDAAITVVTKIHEKGGTSGETVQVAAWLGHETVDSGAFRLRTGAAQTFGLLSIAPGTIELTDLGRRIVDPQTEAAARVDAFLSVPLYNRIYETFKTGMLPKDIGLENEMQRLGVPPKQADTARQVFARSAKQAGFFESGTDRLVKPVVRPIVVIPEKPPREDVIGQDGGGGGGRGEQKTIVLRGGGELTLVASVKFLSMPREDRNFVFELLDKLTEYDERRMIEAPKGTPTPAEQAAV